MLCENGTVTCSNERCMRFEGWKLIYNIYTGVMFLSISIFGIITVMCGLKEQCHNSFVQMFMAMVGFLAGLLYARIHHCLGDLVDVQKNIKENDELDAQEMQRQGDLSIHLASVTSTSV